MIKPLKIGNLTASIPIVQAGMGVQISKSELAAACANAGAIGCISSVGLGTLEASLANYLEDSRNNLIKEIRNFRRLSPNGILSVNVMCALVNYDDIVKTCVQEKVDIIISGAGLPLGLPALTKGSTTKVVPVVSSGRTMKLIMKAWHRRYQQLPDAVVVEGPLCGGHMAFTYDQLGNPTSIPISQILQEVREVLEPYEAEYGRKVPILGAEGVATAEDSIAMMDKGFDGAQVGTRFILTEESGIHPDSKEVYRKATADDVTIIQSPLGLPVKVLRTPLVQKLERDEKIKFGCPFICLRACKAGKARFCLADALVNTLFGDTDNGLFMTGSSIGRINEITPAAEFFEPFKKMM